MSLALTTLDVAYTGPANARVYTSAQRTAMKGRINTTKQAFEGALQRYSDHLRQQALQQNAVQVVQQVMQQAINVGQVSL